LLYPTELQAQSRKIRSRILSFQTASEGNTLADRYKLYHQQGRLSSTFFAFDGNFSLFSVENSGKPAAQADLAHYQ
jgi:hypothetical protein